MSLRSQRETTPLCDSASESEGRDSYIHSGVESNEGEDMHAKEYVGEILKEFAMVNRRLKGNTDSDEDDNDDETIAYIAEQSSILVAPILADYFCHPSRTFPTLEAGQASLRGKAHLKGFAIKKKYEKNADKQEGERSQRTRKEFQKRLYLQCVCAGRRLAMHP
uniref:Uncharacterized protein n=1 Tax=Peronospora matthiolae TaxID=2874970 RepID=A0AAV1VKW8_9STRA